MNWIDWTLLTIFYILPAIYWFIVGVHSTLSDGRLLVADLLLMIMLMFTPILGLVACLSSIMDKYFPEINEKFLESEIWRRNDKPKT